MTAATETGFKRPGSDLILVAGRNRIEAHKRTEHWVSARIIRGETPEIVRAVKLCEIEENFNRRKLSPALRKMYTAQLKVIRFPIARRTIYNQQ